MKPKMKPTLMPMLMPMLMSTLMPMRVVVRVLALGLLLAPQALRAQRPTFAPTLFWESGLINTPAAFVAPLGGDLSISYSRLALDSASLPSAVSRNSNYNLSIITSLWGRAEVGLSIFSGDIRSGLFGKLMLLDQTNGIWRRGLVHWLPSVAVGIRNVGGETSLNRLALVGATRVTTAPTLYGVATRTMVLAAAADGQTARPKAQLSLSAGYGTGLFKDDGGLGKVYSSSSTGGVFGGASLDIATGGYSNVSIMVEHDAWAVNAGVRADWRGIRVSLYETELTASAPPAAVPGALGTYATKKLALSLGWDANVLTIMRGNGLERRTARFTRQQNDLAREALLAQQRIDQIESQINALRAVASEQKNAERAELERRLREEQAALKQLQETIKARETVKKPPADGMGR